MISTEWRPSVDSAVSVQIQIDATTPKGGVMVSEGDHQVWVPIWEVSDLIACLDEALKTLDEIPLDDSETQPND